MGMTLLLSGGLDGVVLAHHLAAEKMDFEAVHFRFSSQLGERAERFAKATADKLGKGFRQIKLDGIAEAIASLIPADRFAGDEHDTANEEAAAVPSAMLMLPSIAAFVAQAANRPTLVLGIIRNQAERSPGLVEALNRIPETVGLLNRSQPEVEVVLPFAGMTKAAVIRRGEQLGVDFTNTWSCLDATRREHCGKCPQCQERRRSFVDAGVIDPTEYAA